MTISTSKAKVDITSKSRSNPVSKEQLCTFNVLRLTNRVNCTKSWGADVYFVTRTIFLQLACSMKPRCLLSKRPIKCPSLGKVSVKSFDQSQTKARTSLKVQGEPIFFWPNRRSYVWRSMPICGICADGSVHTSRATQSTVYKSKKDLMVVDICHTNMQIDLTLKPVLLFISSALQARIKTNAGMFRMPAETRIILSTPSC